MATGERVVIVAPNWLGDAVMALPAVADLRAHFAGARLAVAARASVAPLFAMVDGVDEVVTLPGRGGLAALNSWREDAAALAAGAFETAVLLPNSFVAALTASRAAIAERWGFATDWRGRYLTRAVPKARGPMHQAAYYQALVAGLGVPTGPMHARVNVTRAGLGGGGSATRAEAGSVDPATRVSAGSGDHVSLASAVGGDPSGSPLFRARQVLAEAGISADAPFVVLAPGAAYGRAKQWLPERFAELSALVTAELGWQVVLVGSRADAAVCAEIASWLPARGSRLQVSGSRLATAGSHPASPGSCPPALIDLSGRTDLAALAGVLSLSRAVVANDSGAMHLAGAVGARVVAVFGATNEERTAPLTSGPAAPVPVILSHKAFCRPCMLRECPIDHRCMRGVTARQAFAAITQSPNPSIPQDLKSSSPQAVNLRTS